MIRFGDRLGQVESRRVRIQTYDREGELEETNYYIEQGELLIPHWQENEYFSDESDISEDDYGDEEDQFQDGGSETMSYAAEDSD